MSIGNRRAAALAFWCSQRAWFSRESALTIVCLLVDGCELAGNRSVREDRAVMLFRRMNFREKFHAKQTRPSFCSGLDRSASTWNGSGLCPHAVPAGDGATQNHTTTPLARSMLLPWSGGGPSGSAHACSSYPDSASSTTLLAIQHSIHIAPKHPPQYGRFYPTRGREGISGDERHRANPPFSCSKPMLCHHGLRKERYPTRRMTFNLPSRHTLGR